ncbi:TPA: PTS fructose transporter subunit IIB [Streptococcus agalactiae]|nr:PTS fructose transporter subunit IIB [Streptococcus agalactiae]HEO5911815.1 PTS fructose transporter subunit IIB [Streptococcus agalactiae]
MKIVGVAACTVGIAHTYIAQEKLENASKAADIVLLAVDVKIAGEERFEGKKVVKVPTEVAIKSPNKLIAKLVEVASN